MADILALVSVGSTLRKAIASDRVVYPGDVLVNGDVIIRGGEEVDSLETLMPVVVAPGVAGSGGEALRFDTTTPATGANPIMHGGYIQFGSRCWDGAASQFGSGIRITPRIDTQAAGVPATYHMEINTRTGTELWRIAETGVVTMTNDLIVANTSTAITSGNYKLNIAGGIAAGAVDAVEIRSVNGLTAGGHIVVFGNAAFDYAYVNYDGGFVQNGQGFGANEHDAFAATNITAASGATPVQVSGRSRWAGSAWNSGGGGSVETHAFREYLLPVTSATLTTASMRWGYSFNGAAMAEIMELKANSLTDGVATSYGGTLVINRDTIGASSSAYNEARRAICIKNNTAATNATQVQVSPAICKTGAAWNGATSDTWEAKHLLIPVAAATTSAYISWQTSKNGAAFVEGMRLTGAGVLTVSATGSYVAAKTALGTTRDAPSTANPTAQDGILLTNNASGATGVNEYSPSLRFDSVGFTAGPTYTRHSWAIVSKSNAATTNELSIEWSLGGAAYSRVWYLTQSGLMYTSSGYSFSGANGSLGYGTVMGSTLVYLKGNKTDNPLGVVGSYANVAGAVGVRIGNETALTDASAKIVSFYNATVEKAYIDYQGTFSCQGRVLGFQGADVAAANDITLGLGNYFDVTGATEVQRILGTGWTAGSMVTLQFDSNPNVKHGTAAGASYYGFQLAGAADFAATAGDTLTLRFDGAWWREIARTAI